MPGYQFVSLGQWTKLEMANALTKFLDHTSAASFGMPSTADHGDRDIGDTHLSIAEILVMVSS